MMLISAGRTPIEYSNMSELDQAMTNVINNRNLSSLEKINLYSWLLQKNLKMEEKIKANETPVPEIPPKEAVATVKQESVEPSKPPSKRKEKDYKGPFRILTAHMLLVNFCLILLIRMCTFIISQKK